MDSDKKWWIFNLPVRSGKIFYNHIKPVTRGFYRPPRLLTHSGQGNEAGC
ncbi:hypothetical protein Cabys_1325 [Caldithrix abyssi DSM 13497]|uniref:Uncharacterized protein n=1 Tax=Caldithrix abyssi DSM 13497 TaxID=880073 RepID=A0A1J1C7U3_CALAY|nr:hypothetical protein Cabys_1325 [Caldithrix abyssi DSM 13497]